MNIAIKQGGYEISVGPPNSLSTEDISACFAIIKAGEAVDPESAEHELPLAAALAVIRREGKIVGTGAVKRIRRGYTAIVAGHSGTDFPSDTPELGYIGVQRDHQGDGLASRILDALLASHPGPLFATTSNPRMKSTLGKAGFVQEGQEWDGQSGRLSLWIKV